MKISEAQNCVYKIYIGKGVPAILWALWLKKGTVHRFSWGTSDSIFTLVIYLFELSSHTSETRPPWDHQSFREQQFVRKGIERLEKHILQFINVFIPRDETNIALFKKMQNCWCSSYQFYHWYYTESFTKLCRL